MTTSVRGATEQALSVRVRRGLPVPAWPNYKQDVNVYSTPHTNFVQKGNTFHVADSEYKHRCLNATVANLRNSPFIPSSTNTSLMSPADFYLHLFAPLMNGLLPLARELNEQLHKDINTGSQKYIRSKLYELAPNLILTTLSEIKSKVPPLDPQRPVKFPTTSNPTDRKAFFHVMTLEALRQFYVELPRYIEMMESAAGNQQRQQAKHGNLYGIGTYSDNSTQELHQLGPVYRLLDGSTCVHTMGLSQSHTYGMSIFLRYDVTKVDGSTYSFGKIFFDVREARFLLDIQVPIQVGSLFLEDCTDAYMKKNKSAKKTTFPVTVHHKVEQPNATTCIVHLIQENGGVPLPSAGGDGMPAPVDGAGGPGGEDEVNTQRTSNWNEG